MSDRLTRPELFMRVAYLIALRGTCPRASVGALIVKDGRIVSMGYNGAAPGEEHCTDAGCQGDNGCTRAVHAEANAISFAAKAGVSTEGATLYTTHSPCPVCARLIAACGIIRVTYEHEYRDEEGLRLLGRLGIDAAQYRTAGM